jgi:UDP-N-acetylmuramyl pentapeptide phosphotransferase/UDP-N-acetylglucosamine-1-phosphate transferase
MMIFSFFLAVGAALTVGWFIERYDHLHAWATHDAIDSDGRQKFHTHPRPRVGGAAVAVGLCAAVFAVTNFGNAAGGQAWLFLVACLPAFLAGFVEDLTKKIGPDIRLWASFLSALLAVLLFDVAIDSVAIPWVNNVLHWYPAAVLFSVVAVAGIAHAVNIIDGNNGLAGMASVLMLLAIAWVAWLVGDLTVCLLAVLVAGATLGFLFWNWPRARMFAGDGGAYLWGVSVGILCVLLVGRNAAVSPWFALLVVCYPVTETVFTIYRRKVLQKTASGLPDARHLHQFIYRRILGGSALPKNDERCEKMNSATSPFLWCLSLVAIIPAALFWNKTEWLMMFAMVFILIYLWLYRAIVKFQTPQWLSALGKRVAQRAKPG